MAKRKYVRYTLEADFGNIQEHFEDYREAFTRYRLTESPKTLYAFNEQGDISVIFSKG
jgi:hypothetical protein